MTILLALYSVGLALALAFAPRCGPMPIAGASQVVRTADGELHARCSAGQIWRDYSDGSGACR